MLLADPLGSVLTDVVRTGSIQKPAGSWLIEGIGEDFVPPNCELDRVREAFEIPDCESVDAARLLLRPEGILGGRSVEPRVGKECGGTGRSWRSPYHYKKQTSQYS